jgi:D-tagatose-1,6-bisphosphate aldolase subunit GatZ/KbaZ
LKRARSNARLARISSLIDPLHALVHRHKAGERVGITSVCSAHPLVLEAAMTQARHTGATVLVEATSNQVDQFGGYTGMRPADFAALVRATAQRARVPASRVVLGGDHLGPNRWRGLGPEVAMAHAQDLIAAYVRAGFTKLHLDCSMPCAGDPAAVGDELAAGRAARLMRSAEDTAGERAPGLCYVIGTEVPVPGGAREAIGELVPTSPGAARATLAAHRAAIGQAGLDRAWPRIRALVVQPGVEFDEWGVAAYAPERTVALQRVLADEPGMVFEAHSTDYQTPESLAALVADHWAVLKVGPGLTFALREALFALAAIEDELVSEPRRSRLVEVLDERMLAQPDAWESHHHGDPQIQRVARRYSFSDRLRYYWPDPAVHAAQQRLLHNLQALVLPLPLLSQHLPLQYARVREGALSPAPRALVIDHVRDVLRTYDRACGVMHDNTAPAPRRIAAQ